MFLFIYIYIYIYTHRHNPPQPQTQMEKKLHKPTNQNRQNLKSTQDENVKWTNHSDHITSPRSDSNYEDGFRGLQTIDLIVIVSDDIGYLEKVKSNLQIQWPCIRQHTSHCNPTSIQSIRSLPSTTSDWNKDQFWRVGEAITLIFKICGGGNKCP